MMVRNMKKDSIDWLFDQQDVEKAVLLLGARNLTEIKAVMIGPNYEAVYDSFDKMVQYDSRVADEKTIEWIKKTLDRHRKDNEKNYYLYFRLTRTN